MAFEAWMSPPLPMPRLHIPGWAAALLAALLALLLLAQLSLPTLPLTRIRLSGPLERVTLAEVHTALAPHLAAGFFAVDVRAAKADLMRLPWVAQARVDRRWPGQLRVRIWERQALAVWNGEGLLDHHGVAFQPPRSQPPQSLIQGLPQLAGPANSEAVVLATWQRLDATLAHTALALSELRLDERGEWSATSRDGIALRFGRDAPEHQLDLLTGTVLPRLQDRLAEVAHIDLRYSNGFAVGWKNRPPEQPREPS